MLILILSEANHAEKRTNNLTRDMKNASEWKGMYKNVTTLSVDPGVLAETNDHMVAMRA